METITAIQAADLLDCTRETIRTWSIEFKTFLSPGANPPKNKQRNFTPDDLRVLALVSSLKQKGKLYADIHAALANGQRVDPPVNESAIVPAPQSKIAQLQAQVEQYRTALNTAIEDGQRKAGKIELLERQLSEAQAKIDRLIGENAVLKAGKHSE